MEEIKKYIKTIPDFPKKGIMFRDISGIMGSGEGFRLAIDCFDELTNDVEYDIIVAPESRGFIFATPLGYKTGKPVIPVRKKGKLPGKTIEASYELEYGTATLEMHDDAIKPGQKAIIIDDLIATGGTTEAIIKLVEQLGGEVVKIAYLIELVDLKGREKLKDYEVVSVVTYEGE